MKHSLLAAVMVYLLGLSLLAAPAVAQGELRVSPPKMTVELLANGTGEAEFTVIIPDVSCDVEIGVENIPLDYDPKTVWVEAGEEGTEVVLTFYGDESVASMVIVGKITFLPVSEAMFVPGIKVPTHIIHRAGDVAPTPARSLDVSVEPPGSGSVKLDPTGGTYTSGEEVTLTAVPAEGYIFDRWSGDASGTGGEVGITMDEDKSVTGHFTEAPPPAAEEDEGLAGWVYILIGVLGGAVVLLGGLWLILWRRPA